MPTITTNGIDLYYELHGDGPTVVLIPGLGYNGWMWHKICLLYTSPSPRDRTRSRMPSSA